MTTKSNTRRNEDPSKELYEALSEVYHRMNREFFAKALPNCIITLQRKANSYGFFCSKRFRNSQGGQTDEIALNPIHFHSRTERGVLSTLLHEMIHLKQYHFGRPGRRGYHNREWADWMIGVGLSPSVTGLPGGKEIGYRMTHYIVEGGPYDRFVTGLLDEGFSLPWGDDIDGSGRPGTFKVTKGRTDSSNRWKYTCPHCGLNAWAKPEVSLICGSCFWFLRPPGSI